MKFRTEIKIKKSEFDINHKRYIMSFGSCFSEHMGNRLTENKFRIQTNPFGVLYNPHSISSVIRRVFSDTRFTEQEIVFHNNLYQSFMHHGSFSSPDKTECLKKINASFSNAAKFIQQTDLFLITFGTSYIFNHKSTGKIVANCHKFPADTFIRKRLTVTEIVDDWNEIIRLLQKANPNVKIIFTVSPIRHWKDGAHENQLSKAVLHLAIDELTNIFGQSTTYFPAYEILIDELRDYRFYAEDMMHPSHTAVNYIWQRFSETYFNDDTQITIKEWQQILKSINHKPFNSRDKNHIRFLEKTLQQLESLQRKHHEINFDPEIKSLLKRIQQ